MFIVLQKGGLSTTGTANNPVFDPPNDEVGLYNKFNNRKYKVKLMGNLNDRFRTYGISICCTGRWQNCKRGLNWLNAGSKYQAKKQRECES